MSKPYLPVSILKETLHYDPETGVFNRYMKGKGVSGPAVEIKEAGTVNCTGRRIIYLRGTPYYAHRLAFLYVHWYMPKLVAHDDQNPSNNRIGNLKGLSHKENMKNQKIPSHNTSGTVGVGWCKEQNKWLAQIMVNGKTIKLGRFKDIEDAKKCRKRAEIKYGFHKLHGEAA